MEWDRRKVKEPQRSRQGKQRLMLKPARSTWSVTNEAPALVLSHISLPPVHDRSSLSPLQHAGEIQWAVFWSFSRRPFYSCYDFLLKKVDATGPKAGTRGGAHSKNQQDATGCPHTQQAVTLQKGYQRFLLMLRNQVNMGIPEDELLC